VRLCTQDWCLLLISLKEKDKEEALVNEEMDPVKANNGRPVNSGNIVSTLESDDICQFPFLCDEDFPRT